jgi:hypothetical protein
VSSVYDSDLSSLPVTSAFKERVGSEDRHRQRGSVACSDGRAADRCARPRDAYRRLRAVMKACGGERRQTRHLSRVSAATKAKSPEAQSFAAPIAAAKQPLLPA